MPKLHDPRAQLPLTANATTSGQARRNGPGTWKEAGIPCHDAPGSTGKSEDENKPAAPARVVELV